MSTSDFDYLYRYDVDSPSGFVHNFDKGNSIKSGQVAGSKNKGGWSLFYTDSKGKRHNILAHRKIWEMFNNMTLPKGMCIKFNDGDKYNVRPSNLSVESRSTVHSRARKDDLAIQKKGNIYTLRMRFNGKRNAFCFKSEQEAIEFKQKIMGDL